MFMRGSDIRTIHITYCFEDDKRKTNHFLTALNLSKSEMTVWLLGRSLFDDDSIYVHHDGKVYINAEDLPRSKMNIKIVRTSAELENLWK